jgi:hypothetical protein
MTARFGTLSDFNTAKKNLEKAGLKVTVEKSPNDMIRKLIIGKDTVALRIARLGAGQWSFVYNDKVFNFRR